METKQIIAMIAIIGVAAAAIIGGAYAYSATLVNVDNTTVSNYLTIDDADGTASSYIGTFGLGETPLEWNTVTAWDGSWNSTGDYISTYTPVGADVTVAGVPAKKINSAAYTIEVNGAGMNDAHYYVFTVQTSKNLNGGYAMQFTYGGQTAYVILKGTDKINMIVSDSHDATQQISMDLYAIQFRNTPDLGSQLSYEDVDFTFVAESKVIADGKVLTATLNKKDSTAYSADAASVAITQAQVNGGSAIVSVKNSDATPSDGIYKYTLPAGSYTITALNATGGKFYGTATVNDTAASADVTAQIQSLAITTEPTKMSYTVGEAFDTAGMVVKAVYACASEDAAFVGYTATPANGTVLTAEDTSLTVSVVLTDGSEIVSEAKTITVTGA